MTTARDQSIHEKHNGDWMKGLIKEIREKDTLKVTKGY